MAMTPEIIVSLISLIGTVFGSFAGILISNRLTNYRISQLEKKVAQHNNLIDRTYNIEKHNAVVDEEIKTLSEKINELDE